jgi:hypothetical protein
MRVRSMGLASRPENEYVIVPFLTIPAKDLRQAAKRPGVARTSHLISSRREEMVLDELQSGAGQELAIKKIPEYRGDMSRLADLIHHAYLFRQKKLHPGRRVIHVGRREDANAALLQEAANISQKTDRAFHVLDYFHCCHHREGVVPQATAEISNVEVYLHKRDAVGLESRRILVRARHVAAQRLHTHRKRTASGSQINDTVPRMCKAPDHAFEYKIVQARNRTCS